MRRIVFVLALLWPFTAMAEIAGPGRVIDGNTLDIGGWRVVLHGIDAPEPGQACILDDRQQDCGIQASFALAGIVGRHWLKCVEKGQDPQGQVIAVCFTGPYNVNATIVRDGWALADRQQSADYVPFEEQARAAARGLWRGRFVPPWRWRQGERLAPAKAPEPPNKERGM